MKSYNYFKGLSLILSVALLSILSSCGSDETLTADFPDQTFTVAEDTEVGTVLGVIPDAISVVVNSGNDEGVFAINNGNQVVLARALDFEITPSYTLEVTACEDNNVCADLTVTVEVTDVVEPVTFSFMGTDYSIDGGEVYDYGAVNYVDFGDATHYNYDFVVYDGIVDLQNETFIGTFFIYAELLSDGVTEFKPGTFTFMLPESSSEVAGENYFEYAEMVFDANQNNSVLDAEDLYYIPFDGTIEVVDNGNDNYTMTYDLDIVQFDPDTESLVQGSETTLEFTVTTDFDYFNETDATRTALAKRIFQKRK